MAGSHPCRGEEGPDHGGARLRRSEGSDGPHAGGRPPDRRPQAGNDLILEWDGAVSRYHAELEFVAGCWFVTDLDSANGTWVNGKRIDPEEGLRVGDELRIGDTSLWLVGRRERLHVDHVAGAQGADAGRSSNARCSASLPSPGQGQPRSPCSTTKDIASRMFVGEAAVKAHLSSLYVKFDIPEEGQQRRALLTQRAWETGTVRRQRLRGRRPKRSCPARSGRCSPPAGHEPLRRHSGHVRRCHRRRMTDDRRPRTPWVMWLLVGIGALWVLRILLAAASRVLELASTVVGLAAVASWCGGSRSGPTRPASP